MPRPYADLVGEYHRGRAGGIASSGDFDGASRAAMAVDPALAETYASMGDRARSRSRAQEMDSASRSYAQAIASGDYEGAAQTAAGVGNVEGVSGARSLQAEITLQQRTDAWRALQDYADRVEAVASSPDPQAGWSQLLATAREQSASSPELQQVLNRFPDQWSPQVQQMVRGTLRTWQERLLTPQQLAELELTGRRLEIQERGADVAERRAAAAERTAEAAMLRADRAGRGGFGEDGLSGEQVRAEREFARDWRGVYNNFAEIRQSQERIETVASQRNSAGDLALVVAFTKMLDPGSVAREGEVALTQSAASALAQAQNFLPRLQRGNTLLPDNVRAQLVQTAREMYGNYERAYNRLASDYGRTADAYGFDRNRVMMGYREAADAAEDGPPPRPPNVPEDYNWDGEGWVRPD